MDREVKEELSEDCNIKAEFFEMVLQFSSRDSSEAGIDREVKEELPEDSKVKQIPVKLSQRFELKCTPGDLHVFKTL